MKVIYKRPITQIIIEKKYEAAEKNKVIDYIEVTKDEAVELYDDLNNCGVLGSLLNSAKIYTIHNCTVYDIKIKVEGYKQ